MKAGAYKEALQALDVIVAIAPDDPWAPLYRELCESRLTSPDAITKMAAEQLDALTQRLRREEEDRARRVAQRKAMERAITQEQRAWDQELERIERKQAMDEQHVQLTARQEEKRKRQEAREAKQRERAEEKTRKRLAASTAPTPAAPTPTTPESVQEPEEVETETLVAEADQPAPPTARVVAEPQRMAQRVDEMGPAEQAASVELEPVIVSQHPSEPVVAAQRREPGAVEINGRYMSMSPDRKLAIAEGDVEVLYGDTRILCDKLTLFTDTNDAYLEGRVRIEEGTSLFRSEMAHYNLDTKKGRYIHGTMSEPPWHEYGRWSEQLAEGVYRVTPGYITSCDHEPPHFKFAGKRATVFSDDGFARMRQTALIVDKVPVFYSPRMIFSNSQSPFYVYPGKRKPWGHYLLTGYRYELENPAGFGEHEGTLKLDWRRHFGWGMGADHEFQSRQLGKGLLKVYYNDLKNRTEPNASLPKGADGKRYRLLWRHTWRPLPDTTVITDIQEFSDENFRKDLLFREEFVGDDLNESFVSMVTNTRDYTLTAEMRKRVNRFTSVDEALPNIELDVREQRIGETRFFSRSSLGVGNFTRKRKNSELDDDVVRVNWFQLIRYALPWVQPFSISPKAGVRQTYYTKDEQGSDREGRRDLISGQGNLGVDTSIKFFRLFPITTNRFGLNLQWLRHVVTPTIEHNYFHSPTVPNDLLNFAAARGTSNVVTFGLGNKLQTKRPTPAGKLRSVDLARFLVSLPYRFHGSGNSDGAEFGNWDFDLELYPWPWMRLETDWKYESHETPGLDSRVPRWETDLVLVGGPGKPTAKYARDVKALAPIDEDAGTKGGIDLIPLGQWYLGMSHRYARNDKTEDVVQFDMRISEKWEIGTFHRFTVKEVIGGKKRFGNMREYQYRLRRDLHDWVGELVWRVDREFGEELNLMFTLKAYPDMPFELGESYHQPKFGSQSSPFSPIQSR